MMDDAILIPRITSPAQSLCVRCGLCCDGTIFQRARLAPEDDRTLLAAIGILPVSTAQGEGFRLPCHHHRQRICTIYASWRPQVCHSFRCSVLRRLDSGELSLDEACEVVTHTVNVADRVWAQMRQRAGVLDEPLQKLFCDWEASQGAGDSAWRRDHAAFLLEYAGLQLRLDRDFRLKPK